ncbi:hypothetical protein E3O19_08750 [Cryobacterium algoritolerans]|uniref:Uncharacterized protein n=1 Tax=Cryobacterium algoritolerans TaxID=1259184 RepID=A0A4R8WX20_9MICO|nr:hypothetical protein [Cryobacterium algoritolerans]TFC15208.1 hypothetical protein E3O19_08750 [Cryobacterium algoritolerans]
MFDKRVNASASRWISVIFLQGEQADTTLDLIDRRGPTAAIEYLQQWDFGDETTDAALTNGYVYERIPAGSTDRTLTNDDSPYALTYSPPFGYVSLLRRYPAESELELASAPRASAKQSPRAREDVADIWVAPRDRSAQYARHPVAL